MYICLLETAPFIRRLFGEIVLRREVESDIFGGSLVRFLPPFVVTI